MDLASPSARSPSHSSARSLMASRVRSSACLFSSASSSASMRSSYFSVRFLPVAMKRTAPMTITVTRMPTIMSQLVPGPSSSSSGGGGGSVPSRGVMVRMRVVDFS